MEGTYTRPRSSIIPLVMHSSALERYFFLTARAELMYLSLSLMTSTIPGPSTTKTQHVLLAWSTSLSLI